MGQTNNSMSGRPGRTSSLPELQQKACLLPLPAHTRGRTNSNLAPQAPAARRGRVPIACRSRLTKKLDSGRPQAKSLFSPTKFAAPRRASWNGGAYAADPLISKPPVAKTNCASPQAVLVKKGIDTREQLLRTLRVAAEGFKQGNGEIRTISTKLAELRDHTLLLAEALEQYEQTHGVFIVHEGGSNYVHELVQDMGWLDELPIVKWLGMWALGNPFLLPTAVVGKPLASKPYLKSPPKRVRTSHSDKGYKPVVQPSMTSRIKNSLQYLRRSIKRSHQPVASKSTDEVCAEQVDLAPAGMQRSTSNVVRHQQRDDAAVELQRCWRGNSVRSHKTKLSPQQALARAYAIFKTAATPEQAIRARELVLSARLHLEQQQQGAASVQVQRCWRGHKGRRQVVQSQRVHGRAAAGQQRCRRGSFAAGSMVTGTAVKQQERDAAAVQLQRCWRGNVVRHNTRLSPEQALVRAYAIFKTASTPEQTNRAREMVFAARLHLQQQQQQQQPPAGPRPDALDLPPAAGSLDLPDGDFSDFGDFGGGFSDIDGSSSSCSSPM